MARFRKIFQTIRQTSTSMFTKSASNQPQPALEELILEPPHTSPRSYQQIHASPTVECWNAAETRSLHVANPDRGSSSSASTTPLPPSRSPPPPPPTLPELFDGDDITPESFELQVTDEQEDMEPEQPVLTYPPRPSSGLETRLAELSPLDGSLFPSVITFKDSPFPIVKIQEANATKRRSAPRKLSQGPEIFSTPPLAQRLTRKRRRVMTEQIFAAENLDMAKAPAQEQQLIRIPNFSKPLPPTPRDETQRILQTIFTPAAEEARRQSQLDNIEGLPATHDGGKQGPTMPDTTKSWLDSEPATPPIWHTYLTPSPAPIPSGLSIDLGNDFSSWHLPAFWAANSGAISARKYITFSRQSLRWQPRTLILDYNGRISRFDRDYFTHRSDKRKRFVEEDWEQWVRQLSLAKLLARRITLMLDDIGEFSIDFENWPA